MFKEKRFLFKGPERFNSAFEEMERAEKGDLRRGILGDELAQEIETPCTPLPESFKSLRGEQLKTTATKIASDFTIIVEGKFRNNSFLIAGHLLNKVVANLGLHSGKYRLPREFVQIASTAQNGKIHIPQGEKEKLLAAFIRDNRNDRSKKTQRKRGSI